LENFIDDTIIEIAGLECSSSFFFRALQSKQWSNGHAKTVDQLIEKVLLAFDEFDPPMKLSFGCLTLMSCFG
jgi:hypothetical protein